MFHACVGMESKRWLPSCGRSYLDEVLRDAFPVSVCHLWLRCCPSSDDGQIFIWYFGSSGLIMINRTPYWLYLVAFLLLSFLDKCAVHHHSSILLRTESLRVSNYTFQFFNMASYTHKGGHRSTSTFRFALLHLLWRAHLDRKVGCGYRRWKQWHFNVNCITRSCSFISHPRITFFFFFFPVSDTRWKILVVWGYIVIGGS